MTNSATFQLININIMYLFMLYTERYETNLKRRNNTKNNMFPFFALTNNPWNGANPINNISFNLCFTWIRLIEISIECPGQSG